MDAIAGITVALVLIPQSMAYAQLAGLPAYYGLYAAFLPPMIAAMFGSSMQLATGPVAIVSLMTSASLEPLATAGSEAFIAYAILLALAVGIFQLALGGAAPGPGGQLPVPPGGQRLHQRGGHHHRLQPALQDVRGIRGQGRASLRDDLAGRSWGPSTTPTGPPWPWGWGPSRSCTGSKRLNPKIPYVLVAVAVATLVSWATGFHHDRQVNRDRASCRPKVRQEDHRVQP